MRKTIPLPKSADRHYCRAEQMMALRYQSGVGGPRDLHQARAWLVKAADHPLSDICQNMAAGALKALDDRASSKHRTIRPPALQEGSLREGQTTSFPPPLLTPGPNQRPATPEFGPLQTFGNKMSRTDKSRGCGRQSSCVAAAEIARSVSSSASRYDHRCGADNNAPRSGRGNSRHGSSTGNSGRGSNRFL